MSICWREERIEELARLASLDPDDVQHAAECADCRAKLEAARRDLELLAELRTSAAKRAARASAHSLVPGYRVEGEIRRGGQGVVHRAIQESTHRAVALKILSAPSARERRRFEREIALVSRLHHPYVVTVIDSGIAGDLPWYAMELVDGRPLDEWARSRLVTVRKRVELFARICSGVAHAHQRGVIHRDLKPENILVNTAGEPRILDFGAALSSLDPRERLRVTAPGEFVGTLAYAAPEQLRGSATAIDTRTDVYALGVVLYELLAGAPPHDRSGGVAEIVERVAALDPPPPSACARDVDRDLDAITMKALSKDAADRYGTAESLERDVARYLAGEPVEARRHSSAYLLRKFVAKRKKRIALAAALCAGASVVAFAWVREHLRAEQQSEIAGAVRSIVNDMLGAASPQRMGGEARLIDVYELVARDLDRTLASAPDVQAEAELTMGDTFRRLLRPAEAELHLRKALTRFREIDDAKELQLARAENLLALALADQNRAEAIEHAEKALAVRERELAPTDPLLAESRRTLALALTEQLRDQDVARARVLLEQSLSGFRAAYGEENADTAETKLCLVEAGGDRPPKEVEALLRQAISTFERVAPDDPRAIACYNAYASFLQQSSRFDEARTTLDHASALAKKLLGDVLATDILRRYARLEFARGDMASAEILSRRALAHELQRWADRRPEDASKLRALAHRIEEPGSPTADPPYASAFGELRKLEGEGVFELAQWMNGIAMTLRALRRTGAIEPMLREALEIQCRAMGPDCPVRQTTLELLAAELVDDRRGGEAVPLLEESLATYKRRGDEDKPEALHASELLDACRRQMTDGGTITSH
jgi:tetratricopeptide (TPR) repeat protein/predicted Ser/Thr protein kinase